MINPTSGAYSDPGVYEHYTINSANGIGAFGFIGNGAAGNTSVDNITVNAAVPEPETYALMLAGLAGVVAVARRRRV